MLHGGTGRSWVPVGLCRYNTTYKVPQEPNFSLFPLPLHIFKYIFGMWYAYCISPLCCTFDLSWILFFPIIFTWRSCWYTLPVLGWHLSLTVLYPCGNSIVPLWQEVFSAVHICEIVWTNCIFIHHKLHGNFQAYWISARFNRNLFEPIELI